MSIEAAIDNDVLIKCACYQFLGEVVEGLGGPGSAGILGSARYVVASQLERRNDLSVGNRAREHFDSLLEIASELEPSGIEIEIATAIEDVAIAENLPLDEGESQLCAMVANRPMRALVTGDKRAVESLELVMDRVAALDRLAGRLACLEQLVLAIADRIGSSVARSRICAEPQIDYALSICFECTKSTDPPNFQPDGLQSYINDLRGRAPTVLHPDDVLFKT